MYLLNNVKVKQLICIAPEELCFRILKSVVPPFTSKYKTLDTDLLGPALAVIILILMLNHTNGLKTDSSGITPLESVVLYFIFMPILCYILNKLGRSSLTFLEIFSLICYGLYGHIITLLNSFVFYREDNVNFFVFMIIFGGLTTLRIVLLQVRLIPLPGARLLVCSVISVIHILFLNFLYFSYLHQNFRYGRNIKINLHKL